MEERRKCRSREFGFHFQRCKGYIDNDNRFFCSYCHTHLTKTSDPDGQTYEQDGDPRPSEMPLLGGESIGPMHLIKYGGATKS